MTFSESIATCFRKYADFEGCASRSEYWWWFLFTLVVSLALRMFSIPLSGLFSLAVLVPSLGVGARRLHDTNLSGWLLLLYLLPVVGWIILLVLFVRESVRPTRFGADAPPAT